MLAGRGAVGTEVEIPPGEGNDGLPRRPMPPVLGQRRKLEPIIAGRSSPWLAAQASLTKEGVKVVVGTDPDPNNRVAIALADRAVLLIDPHRPDLFIAGELLET